MRTIEPDGKWLAALEKERQEPERHVSEFELVRYLWSQQIGHKAAAMVVDIYVSCHPDVIYKRKEGVWPPRH